MKDLELRMEESLDLVASLSEKANQNIVAVKEMCEKKGGKNKKKKTEKTGGKNKTKKPDEGSLKEGRGKM